MFGLQAMEKAWLGAPDKAAFVERACILQAAGARHAHLHFASDAHPPGIRQGRILQGLCGEMTPAVGPEELLLGRVREEVPDAEGERLAHEHPELFTHAGAPGLLQSAGIYVPDWAKLLRLGIGGLLAEVDGCLGACAVAGDEARRDTLEGIGLSLEGVSLLAGRYAVAARQAAQATSPGRATRLRSAAEACAAVALDPPATLRQALQLFVLFHTVLARVVGGRNVTPGRMDQYLRPFYERDLAEGVLTRAEAVELLAAAMVALSQGSGHEAVDWASTKRTPCCYSHYYVTLGGVRPDGESGVSDLSDALMQARRLVRFREPTLCFRYFPGMDEAFWHEAVRFVRDGLPGMVYSDGAEVAALAHHGVPVEVARDYAFCGCLHCFLPGRQVPPIRRHHNGPAMLLRALKEQAAAGAAASSGEAVTEGVFGALRGDFRSALLTAAGSSEGYEGYPLVVRPLFDGWADPAGQPWCFADEALVGLATVVDSLLVIRRAVDGTVSLPALVDALDASLAGHEGLRQRLLRQSPTYGSDDREVTALVERVGRAWVEAVREAGEGPEGVRTRPAFYSWLFHIEMGRDTPATPDGRLAGEPLSADYAPSPGRPHPPTEVLRCLAHLPHRLTGSGGTNLHMDPSHYRGPAGLARLAALLEGYFAEGGLHAQFIWADAATLRDAIEHPEKHGGLLVRVTGFSEYFTRLLPEIQQDMLRRAEAA